LRGRRQRLLSTKNKETEAMDTPGAIANFQVVIFPEQDHRDEETHLFILDDQGRIFRRQIDIGGKPVMDEWQEVLL
jgi:hypothetical protein